MRNCYGCDTYWREKADYTWREMVANLSLKFQTLERTDATCGEK